MNSSSESEDEMMQRHQTPKRLGEKVDGHKEENDVEYEKYLRPVANETEILNPKSKNKRLKRQLERRQESFKDAAVSAARAEILYQEEAGCLEVEGELEKTYRVKQDAIAQHVDLNTSRKIFELTLDQFGPYTTKYSRNGRHLLFGGQKGHLAIVDTLRLDIVREFHTQELIRDITFLHNFSMIAVAQKKYIYIYDSSGAEVHCIRDARQPNRLEFLPYHFLLASAGKGVLRYQDTSTGKVVAHHLTKHGVSHSITHNPWNAVIHLGDSKGVVSLWTPNMPTPVVKMVCHKASIPAIAVDRSGHYMATAGRDHQVKIWDLRKYEELHAYHMFTPATTLDISQRGMLGIGHGAHVEVWKDALSMKASSPYMTEQLSGRCIESVAFQPFEDVLSIGHSDGLRNMVIPGSGEPNIDSYAANPFENTKQQREAEVKSLLDKLQPEMITLDPLSIGRVATEPLVEPKEIQAKVKVVKNKKRGRSKISNKLRNKQVDAFNKHNVEKEKRLAQESHGDEASSAQDPAEQRTALSRFN